MACPNESGELAQLILSANPHLTDRIENFRRNGYYWHDVVPVVCEVQGELASCACIFKRRIRVKDREAAFCGIGGVATRPDFRRQGLASAVLTECESLIGGWGYPLATLFCSIVDFYAQHGWAVAEDRVAEFDLHSRKQPVTQSGYRIRRIEIQEIAESMRAIADRQSAIVRTGASWKEYISWRKEDAALMLAAFAGDQMVAYGRGRQTGTGEWQLMDAAWLPEHGNAMVAILRQQSAATETNGAARCHAFLSPEHPLCPLLDAAAIRVAWRQVPPELGILMTKIIRPACDEQANALRRDDFGTPIPWRPRTWWGVDRF